MIRLDLGDSHIVTDIIDVLRDHCLGFPNLNAQERIFLDRFLFFGLEKRHLSFDSPSIVYFSPTQFALILERCANLGVMIFGVEAFDQSGASIDLAVASTDRSFEFLPMLLALGHRKSCFVSATYWVPPEAFAPLSATLDPVEAYRATEYNVEIDSQRISVRVEKYCPEVLSLLSTESGAAAFILTAWNPFSRQRSRHENESANHRLRRALERLNALLYPAIAAPGTRWVEHGFLILGLATHSIRDLGHAFGQNAALEIGPNGIAQLLVLR